MGKIGLLFFGMLLILAGCCVAPGVIYEEPAYPPSPGVIYEEPAYPPSPAPYYYGYPYYWSYWGVPFSFWFHYHRDYRDYPWYHYRPDYHHRPRDFHRPRHPYPHHRPEVRPPSVRTIPPGDYQSGSRQFRSYPRGDFPRGGNQFRGYQSGGHSRGGFSGGGHSRGRTH